MADYKVTDTELTSVANKIRTKGGSQAQLEWPTGYVSAIDAISGSATLVTKSITQNGTYDPADDNADGYSEVTVNVSGASSPYSINEIDYIEFARNLLNNVIDLPITANADFIYTLEFERLSGGGAVNDIIGTNGDNTQIHLTIYNNKYYCGTGVAEYDFTGSLDGKHTVILNKDNSIYFDENAVLQNVSFTSSAYFLRLGGRNDYYANAKIYRFKIESINSGNVIYDFIPCQILYNNSVVDTGFYDQINQIAYTKKSVGKIYINIA